MPPVLTSSFVSAVLHPGFQHITLACYLYLGRCFQLYNAFIFVSFFSFLHSTRQHSPPFPAVNLHKWEAHLYWAHATGDEAPWKSFLSNQPLQSSAAENSTEKKMTKPPRTFHSFCIFEVKTLCGLFTRATGE